MKHGRGIVNVRVSNLHVISPSSEKDCPGHPILSNTLLIVLVLLLVFLTIYGCTIGR